MSQTHGNNAVPTKLFKFNALPCPLFGLLTPSGGPRTIPAFPGISVHWMAINRSAGA